MVIKNSNKKLLESSLLILGFIFLLGLAFAAHTSSPAAFYVNEDNSSYIFNITINNTNGLDVVGGNISHINVTSLNSSAFVYALGSQGNGTNFSATYAFSNFTDVLSWYNLTEGLITNTTNNAYFWFNASFTTPGVYTLEVLTANLTGVSRTNITVTVNDTTVPEIVVANITSPTISSNKSGTLLFNVSIFDNGNMGSVNITITNSSGSINTTYNLSQTGNSWNYSIPTTSFPDGTYNITVYANDSFGNLNNSAKVYSVVFDNTAPTVSLGSATVSTNSLTLTVSATDATSGLNNTYGDCTVDRSGATISANSIAESSLNCGTSYAYVVTCYDSAGNSANSASTSFSTNGCGSSSGSTGSATQTWTNTYVDNDKELTEKGTVTRDLKKNYRTKLKISGATHYVGVTDLTTTTAMIQITSDPQNATLSIGDLRKFEVTGDDYYDLQITLNNITNNEANFDIVAINEKITTETKSEEQVKEGAAQEDAGIISPETADEKSSLIWLWVLLLIIIISLIIYFVKKLKNPSS
jgi:hypothetical protein